MPARRSGTRATSPVNKNGLPALRRNRTAEAKLSGTKELPGLMRNNTNNSIDPSTLAQKPRRMRNRPSASGQSLERAFQDSGITTSSAYTLASSSNSSFASRFNESVKFSVKQFLNQKEGTLEQTYDMGDLIGEGGFGEVYSCYHLETGEQRAVKVMEKSLEKEHINEQIVSEYNILKELDHPK
jgi:Protein kinase domain